MAASIMVVEDDAVCRSVLAELLRIWGYDTETACDGLDALNKLATSTPQVVISDVQMPGINGVELIRSIRSRAPHVHCIAVTGSHDTSKTAVLRSLGVVDFLQKPLDPQRLRHDLQKCVD